MSRRLSVLFQRLEKARVSDFGGTEADQYINLGPLGLNGLEEYRIGAVFRHLTDEDKTSRGLSLSQDAIALDMVATPVLNSITNRNYVAYINGEYWTVLSIDKGAFTNRRIRIIVGRNRL